MPTVLLTLAVAGWLGVRVDAVPVRPADAPTIVVTTQAEPGVPVAVVERALAVLERVYREIGITIVVARDGCQSAGDGAIARRIMIRRTATAEFQPIGMTPIMGSAPRAGDAPGVVSYIFLDAIVQQARRHGVPTSSLMGYVMAHELGHQLSPPDAHALSGVMRAAWDPHELALIRSSQLKIVGTSAMLMRGYLGSQTSAR